MRDKTALFWRKENEKAVCELCPHCCTIGEGQYGQCFTRANSGGTLFSKSYGAVSALNIDPVEKKPLYNFYPGAKTLSFGSFGCNLKCAFCQNYSISMSGAGSAAARIFPEDAVYFAVEKNVRFISYTYNEPLTDYEWVLETSVLARKREIQNILVSNGYVNQEPLKQLAGFIDAANIDLKAFDEAFYKKNCGGSLLPVLQSIETLYDSKVHIEITNLLIDGENTDKKQFGKLIDFIAGISDEIPLHLSRYFPGHKFTAEKTKEETLVSFYNEAKEKLKYVYIGNFDGSGYGNTYCKKCGHLLIERNGYDVRINCKNPRICCECASRNNIII